MPRPVRITIPALIALLLAAVMIEAISHSSWPIVALMGVGIGFMAIDIVRALRDNRHG